MPFSMIPPQNAQLVLGALLTAPGTLSVNTERLAFQRAATLSGLIAPRAGISFALPDITEISLGPGRLEVVTPHLRSTFLGGGAVLIGTAMLARGLRHTGGERVTAISTARARGPLHQRGAAAIGPHAFVFAPDGAIDGALVGGVLEIPLSSIGGMRVADERLHILTPEGDITLTGGDLRVLLAGCASLLRVPPAEAPVASGESWASPAVCEEPGVAVSPGRAALGADGHLRFRAEGGALLDLGPAERVLRPEAGQGPVLEAADGGWRLRLPDVAAVFRFDAAAISTPPPLPPPSERATLKRLTGRVDSVRFRTGPGGEHSVRPVWIAEGERTLDIFVPDTAAVPEAGARVELLVGVRRGIVGVRTRVVGREAVAREALPTGAGTLFADVPAVAVCRVRWPRRDEVEETRTARRFFRVECGLQQVPRDGVEPTEGPPPLTGRVSNLSIGGLAAISPEPWVAGAPCRVYLPFDDAPPVIDAEIVWAARSRDGQTLVGVRFLDESELFRRQIQQVVFRLERGQLELADDPPTDPSGFSARSAG